MSTHVQQLGLCLLLHAGCASLWGDSYFDPPSQDTPTKPASLVEWTLPPSHLWSLRIGGSGNDQGTATAIDGAGNVVVVGVLAADAPGLVGSVSDPASALRQLKSGGFVMQISPAGAINWAKNLPELGAPAYMPQLAIDEDRNVFVGWKRIGPTSSNDSIQVAKYAPDGRAAWTTPFTMGNQGGTEASISVQALEAHTMIAGSRTQTWLTIAGQCAGQKGTNGLPGPSMRKLCQTGSYLVNLIDNNGPTLAGTTVYEFDPMALPTLLTGAALLADRTAVWTGGSGGVTGGKSILYRGRDDKSFPLGDANGMLGPWALNTPIAIDSRDDAVVAIRFADLRVQRHATSQAGEPGPLATVTGDAFPFRLVLDGGDNPIVAGYFSGMITATNVVLSAHSTRDLFVVKYKSQLDAPLWALPVRVGAIGAPSEWTLGMAADRARSRFALTLQTNQGQGYAPLDQIDVRLNPPPESPGGDNDIIVLYLGTP